MAVKMRLRRMGRKNRPFYRVVVADSRHPRDGRFIDSIGHYDPLQDPAEVVIDEEKVMKWLSKGVELTDTVRSILSREGLLETRHKSKYAATVKAEEGKKTEAKEEKTKADTTEKVVKKAEKSSE
jgi:small subunit ribosomal protein S16